MFEFLEKYYVFFQSYFVRVSKCLKKVIEIDPLRFLALHPPPPTGNFAQNCLESIPWLTSHNISYCIAMLPFWEDFWEKLKYLLQALGFHPLPFWNSENNEIQSIFLPYSEKEKRMWHFLQNKNCYQVDEWNFAHVDLD